MTAEALGTPSAVSFSAGINMSPYDGIQPAAQANSSPFISQNGDIQFGLAVTQLTAYGLNWDGTGTAGPNNTATINGYPPVLGTLSYVVTSPFQDTLSTITAYLNGGGNSGAAGVPVSTVGMVLCELLVFDGVLNPYYAGLVNQYLRYQWGITA